MVSVRDSLVSRYKDGSIIKAALPALLRVSANAHPKTEESITHYAALDFSLNYWRKPVSTRTFPPAESKDGEETLRSIQNLIIAAYKHAQSAQECDALLVIYFNIKSFSIRLEEI